MKVYKYKVPLDDYITLELPCVSKILSFQCQNDIPYIWVLVDPGGPTMIRRFRLAGTGDSITEKNLKYIGTAIETLPIELFLIDKSDEPPTQMKSGQLAWHLFEILED